MRIIIIEDTVYKITEKQYQQIIEIEEEAKNLPFCGDLHIDEHLQCNKEKYKKIGSIDYDFRL